MSLAWTIFMPHSFEIPYQDIWRTLYFARNELYLDGLSCKKHCTLKVLWNLDWNKDNNCLIKKVHIGWCLFTLLIFHSVDIYQNWHISVCQQKSYQLFLQSKQMALNLMSANKILPTKWTTRRIIPKKWLTAKQNHFAWYADVCREESVFRFLLVTN